MKEETSKRSPITPSTQALKRTTWTKRSPLERFASPRGIGVSATLASGTLLAIIQDFFAEYPLGKLALCSFSTFLSSSLNFSLREKCFHLAYNV